MVHACNPSTRGTEAGDLCELKASLVYKATARKPREPPPKQNKQTNKNTKKSHLGSKFSLVSPRPQADAAYSNSC